MRLTERMLSMLALSLIAGGAAAHTAVAPAGTPLPAAELPPEATHERARSRLVEEIVVTAQKREENLQDIPISVQAFSADLLDARGITDQKELQLITPGLDIGTQVSYTMTLSAFKLRVDGAGSNFTINRDPSPLGRLLLMQPQGQYEGAVDSATFNTVDNTVYYGEVTYSPGPFDIKLLGSDQYIDTAGIYDFDGTVIPIASFLPPKNYADVQTGELQLISNADSWGASWLKWIVGGYYFRGQSGFDPIIGTLAGLDLSGYSSSLIGLPPGFVDQLNALAPDLTSVIPTGQLYLVGTVNTESSAVFMQTTISLTDWFDLTLGGRYQSERREIARSATDLRGLNGNDIEVIEYHYAIDQDGNRVGPKDTTKRFSPKVSLEFRPFENDILLYTSYQKATKSATYNTTAITGAPTYVGPETLTAYEAGIKGSALDGLMRYAVAAFYYDIDNLQVQFFSLFNGGIVSFENAKAARSRGLEFDTTIELLPSLFDGLVLAAGGAYVDSQYTDFDDCSGYGEQTGLFNRRLDCTGKNIVRSPKYTGTLSLSKTWEIPGGSLELTGDWYYNDGFFYEANNNPRTEQKSYQVASVRTSYLYERWNLRTTLFVKNLFDEFYSQGALPNDFGDGINVAPPRTYGIRVNWEF